MDRTADYPSYRLELFDPTANTGNGGTTTYSHTGGGTSAFNVGRGEHAAALAGKWIYFIRGWNGVTGGGANFSPSIDALDTTLLPAGGSSGGVDGNGGQTKARGYTRGDGS